jgi:hypothetical protein
MSLRITSFASRPGYPLVPLATLLLHARYAFTCNCPRRYMHMRMHLLLLVAPGLSFVLEKSGRCAADSKLRRRRFFFDK